MKRPRYLDQPIRNVTELSQRLEVSVSGILSLERKADKHYRPNPRQRKPDGSFRQTYRVLQPLEELQQQIKTQILRNVDYPYYLQGSIKDEHYPRSYIKNARLHAGQRILLKDDITDFFPSIKKPSVLRVWSELFCFSDAVANILANLTLLNGSLPQGASTSSYVATLILWDVEPLLEAELRSKGFVYSRNVDDITVSTGRWVGEREQVLVRSKVHKMLQDAGFKPKKRKQKVMTNERRMAVHNLNVNSGEPKIPKEERQRIRTAVRQCELHLDHASADYHKLYKRTEGRVNWLRELHPNQGEKYHRRLLAVRPQEECS